MLNRTGPGTVIVVRPGVYREQVTVAASGSSTNPYELRADGPGVVIDGADDLSGATLWTRVSGDVWRAASVTWSPKQVFLDGARLSAISGPPSSLAPGSFLYVSGEGLYVNAGGANPGLRQLRVGRRLHGFRLVGRSWITISGFTVTGTEDKAIYLSSASDHVTMGNNTVTFAYRSGVQAAGCADVLLDGNVLSDNHDHGIHLAAVRDAVVRNNLSVRNGSAGAEADGLHVSGTSSGVIVQSNQFSDNAGNGAGYELGVAGTVSVQNRSWNNASSGYSVVGATGQRHLGDVAWNNGSAGFALGANATAGSLFNCIAAQNGRTTGDPEVVVETSATTGFVANDNVVWNATSGPIVRHAGVDFERLADFATATGYDTRSFQQDPRFIDPEAGDFHLAGGSPAIDAANSAVAGWPTLDAEGKSRKDDPATPNSGIGPIAYADRGAFEYEPTGSPPIASLGASPSSGRAPLTVTLDAGASSDPDGNIIAFRFDFGDGQSQGPQAAPTATHVYGAGTWTARVFVTDASGSTASATATIAVTSNAAPIAGIHVAADSGAALAGFLPLVTDSMRAFAAVAAPRPGYLEPFTEPTFGTQVVRIAGDAGSLLTTSTGSGSWGADARHHYSKDQPWNSDGSLLALQNNGTPKRVFLDGNNYRVKLGKCSNYFVGDDRWHPSLPNVRINVVGNELQWFDIVTCTKLRSWILPFTPRLLGDGEGNPSWDGRYLALCDSTRMFVVDMDPQSPFAPYPNVRIGPIVDFSNCGTSECRLGWVSVSPSGKYVVCKYSGDHPRVYDLDPVTLNMTPRAMPESSPRCIGTAEQGYIYDLGHGDMTLNPFDGNEDVLIGQEHCGMRGSVVAGQLMGGVVMARLRDGAVTSLTSPVNEAYPHHISTQNIGRPGWAYVGYYPDPGKRFSDEIVAVKMDGSGQVERLAHKHSDTSNDCYRCEAHAVPSPDGRRVVWASNWAIDCFDCGPQSDLKAYLVDLRPFATDTSGVAPFTVVADASSSSDSDGTIVSYRFDFGDGTVIGPQASPRATHTYGAGTWTPSVTVTDDGGGTQVATATIIVRANAAPTGAIDSPASDVTITAGESVVLAGSGVDPDGDRLSYEWDLDGAAPTTSAEDPGAVEFAVPGTYTIRLLVTDVYGVASPAPPTRTITVVAPTDRAPVVVAPITATGSPGSTVTIEVTATDPDDDAITSLIADLSGLPAGHQAVFTTTSGHTSGTLSWTPASTEPAGVYTVQFTAANALTGTASTEVTIVLGNRAPQPQMSVTPASGFAPLAVTVDASTSLDPDGSVASYRFDFGDGTVIGPQTSPIATHTYSVGTRSFILTVTDDDGASAIAVHPVTVHQNLIGNPSFETATTGWNAYGGSTIARVAGGLDGTYALEMRGPATTATFGVNDSPNWISSVQSAGTRYRFSADVRSPSSGGLARLQVREYLSGVQQGVTTKSAGVTLTPEWQTITVDYVTSAAGSTLDFQVMDVPVTTGEVFLTDRVAIRIVHPDTPPLISAPASITVAEGEPIQIPIGAVDPDGQTITSLTANLAALPATANASFTPDAGKGSGLFTWTPGFEHAGGPYDITFTATNTLVGTATTRIFVTNLDRQPIVTAPSSITISEGTPLILHAGASDPDGQPIDSLLADLADLPPGHAASFTADSANVGGTLSWTPSFEHGGQSYRVRLVALNTISNTAEVEITVTEVDRSPRLVAPSVVESFENVPVAVSIEAIDPDGEPIDLLIADLSGLPGRDALFVPNTDKSSGMLTWTPGYNDSGSHAITFLAANRLSVEATTIIHVRHVDRSPVVIVADTSRATEGEPAVVVVTVGDPDGDPIDSLTVDLSGLPAGANALLTTASDRTSGEMTWTPGPDDAGGPYVVSFRAANGGIGTSATALWVANRDRPPSISAPKFVAGREESTIVIEVAASDPDGDSIDVLTAELVEMPFGHDGVFTNDPGNGSGRLIWKPSSDHAPGPYLVTFVAGNALTGIASTEILVENLDRPPSILAPEGVTGTDSTLIQIEISVSDPDGESIDDLTADLSALPVGHDATFVANEDRRSGVLSWTPQLAGAGSFPVTFTASNTSLDTATTVISITAIQHPPVVMAPETVVVDEGAALVIEVHASDPDGDPIASLSAQVNELPGSTTPVFAPSEDQLSGTLTWMPGFSDSGGPYRVRFAAANSDSAFAATDVYVRNVDRAPIIVAPQEASISEGDTLRIEIAASDPDGDGALSLDVDLGSLPEGHGATFVVHAEGGSGVLVWTPGNEDAGGPYVVSIRAANALAAEVGIGITVTNRDRAPIAVAPSQVTAEEGESVTIELTASDPDGEPIDSLSVDTSSLPSSAQASFVVAPDRRSGTFSWSPTFDDGRAAPYELRFVAANTLQGEVRTAIQVGDVDRAPVIGAVAEVTMPQGDSIAIIVTAEDPDGDFIAGLEADRSGLPSGADATFTAASDHRSGTLRWAPAPTDVGGPYLVTFRATNALESSTSTRITVTYVAHAPIVSAPATLTVAEGTTLAFTVEVADANGDSIETLTADRSALPRVNDAAFETGVDARTGTLTWTPTFEDARAEPYLVIFTATNHGTGADTTRIFVVDVDRPPVVTAPAAVTGPEGSALEWSVAVNDPDGDPIDSLTADLSGLPPGHGAEFVVAGDHATGTLLWVPDYAAAGSYRIRILAANALVDSMVASIIVTDVDRAPEIDAPDDVQGHEGTPVTFEVTVTDPDGGAFPGLTADLHALPAGHSAAFSPSPDGTSGTFTWTPGFADSGAYRIGFIVAGTPSINAATMLSVANVDRAPVVEAPAIVPGVENAAIAFAITASDPDGDAIEELTADFSGLPPGAAASFQPAADRRSGTLSWTPSFVDAGWHTVSFRASNRMSTLTTASLQIGETDRPPVVVAVDSASVTAGTEWSVVITANDPDGDPIESLSADLSSLPSGNGASFVFDSTRGSGTLTWRPELGQDGGPYPVTFTASNSATGSHTTALTVIRPNQRPQAALTVSPPVTSVPMLVSASALGSVDPDGAVASYRFDFGNGVVIGPQASPSASSTYAAPGIYTVTLIVTDVAGASDTTTAMVRAHLGNLCTNPGFENTTTGWTNYGSSSLSRVSGMGRGGGYAYQATKSSGSGWGWNDSPDWVPTTAGVGRTYRYVAWVRSIAHRGRAYLRVQEFLGSTQKGTTVTSPSVTVGPEWQLLTLDYTVAASGTRLDMKVLYDALGSGEKVLVDDVQVLLLPQGNQPPLLMAPASVTAIAGRPVSIEVRAADPDGQPIESLFASLAGLSLGHDATFIVDAERGIGTLTWTPSASDIGPVPYSVAFTASNGLAATASVEIVVASAPLANLCANPGVETSASGWTSYGSASITRVNSGRSGSFAVQLSSSSGTGWGLNDSPDIVPSVAGVGRTYRYSAWVRSASNAGKVKLRIQEFLSSTQKGVTTESPEVTLSTTWQRIAVDYTATTANTRLDMKIVNTPVASSEAFLVDDVEVVLLPAGDRPPVMIAPPPVIVARGEPMAMSVTVSDPDGDPVSDLAVDLFALPPSHGATFTVAADKKSGVLSWTPRAEHVSANPYVVTFTATNAKRVTVSSSITVVDSMAANLCRNSGFESDATGWGTYGSVTLARVAGGHSGSFALQMSSISSSSFGCDDNPNWVTSVTQAGARYRFSAWVRSATSTSPVKIRLYEMLNGVQQGSTAYSQEIPVSSAWQQLTLDYTTLKAGSTLSMRVTMSPSSSSQAFLVDDISIRVVAEPPAPTTLALEGGSSEGIAIGEQARAWLEQGADDGADRLSLRIEGIEPFLEGALPSVTLRSGASAIPIAPESFVMGEDSDSNGREELGTLIEVAELRKSTQDSSGVVHGVVTITGQGQEVRIPIHLLLVEEEFVFGAQFGPNPMRGRGVLSFTLTRPGPVRIDLIDPMGRRVRQLLSEWRGAGNHRLAIDGNGAALPPGMYFYRIATGEGVRTGRIVSLR